MGMTVATLAGTLATGTTAKAMRQRLNDATLQLVKTCSIPELMNRNQPLILAASTETKTVPASANNAETPAT